MVKKTLTKKKAQGSRSGSSAKKTTTTRIATSAAAKKTAQKRASGVAKRRHARVVKKLLKKVEDRLGEDEMKATLGDYIRLVQLQKDLEDEPASEMKVTWVESEGKQSGSEE